MNPEKWKPITRLVTVAIIPALVALVLIYDVIALKYGGSVSTISSFLVVQSHENPWTVAIIVGPIMLLFGHLYWRISNYDTRKYDSDGGE